MDALSPPNLPVFSPEQWSFLAVLEALGEPVSPDVAGTLVPLPPGPLLDLMRRGQDLRLLRQNEAGALLLDREAPPEFLHFLKSLNNPAGIARLLENLAALDLLNQVHPETLTGLFSRAERHEDAALWALRSGQKALDRESAHKYYLRGLQELGKHLTGPENEKHFIAAALAFSNLCFIQGRSFEEASRFLETAGDLAEHLGDKRSGALIRLHLGRFFYLADRRHDALRLLDTGQRHVHELGDEDIVTQAAEFLGLYYYMQGRFREALPHLERAAEAFESQSGTSRENPSAPIFLGYCNAYLGNYDNAIGFLDYTWRQAKREANEALALTIRSVLGTVLLLIDKKRRGLFHLHETWKEAERSSNNLAQYLSAAGLAYCYYLSNRMEKGREWLVRMQNETPHSGLVRQFSSPWILEMIYEFEQMGFAPIPGFEFDRQFRRILSEPNVHLKGAALRLRAEKVWAETKDAGQVQEDLTASEAHLRTTGDSLQLAKVRIDMAYIELMKGNRREARLLAQKARKGLSGRWTNLFPDGLRPLLDSQQFETEPSMKSDEILMPFIKVTEELSPTPDPQGIMQWLVSVMNRYLGGERGGLFKPGEKGSRVLKLEAARNLNQAEVEAAIFGPSRAAIQISFRENRPLAQKIMHPANRLSGKGTLSMLCLPFKVAGQVYGVLYHDNSYIDDCFDQLDETTLDQLARHLGAYVEHVLEYGRLLDRTKRQALEKPVEIDPGGGTEMLFESPRMRDVVARADKVAPTDSPVLLQGETGVGKELLARRLHRVSLRSREPFITIDASTIPEQLVESELFGYEKGSFTGADHRKNGRVEMAHKGTLFIDEIGEIPPSIQVKLLRVLQEKTFNRIGGSRELTSDFRLIAATNRNLSEEIAEGRFRKDLYYRINVLQLTLPPLRERTEDIILLARHFVGYYSKKYNQPGLSLTAEDESCLTRYHWPGNIRELRNVMERAVLLASGGRLELNLRGSDPECARNAFEDEPTLDELQRRYILHILEKTGGRIGGPGGAAEKMGLKRTSLYTRMKKLGLDYTRK